MKPIELSVITRRLKMFLAVTKWAGKFKALFEVLFQNMTTVCFTIDKKGFFLEHFTSQNVVISVFLPAEQFEEYVFDEEEPIYIGLGSHINKDFFKHVKNKDVVRMSITKKFIFDFEKRTSSDDCIQSLSVDIESIQNITPVTHAVYRTKPVKISGDNLNQMCRSSNSAALNVTKKSGRIHFSFETGGISVKTLSFGKEVPEDTTMFQQSFLTEQLCRIGKISSFVESHIEAYVEEGMPLFFMCQSVIGTVKIYIEPKAQ